MKYTQYRVNPYSDHSGRDILMFTCLAVFTCFGTNRDTLIYIGLAWILAIIYTNLPKTTTTVILPADAIDQDRLITKKEHQQLLREEKLNPVNMVPFVTSDAYADRSINANNLPDHILHLPALTAFQRSITYAGRETDEPQRGMDLVNSLSHGTVAEAHQTVMSEYKTEVLRRKDCMKVPSEKDPESFSSVILLRDYLHIKEPDTQLLMTTNPLVFPNPREYLK